jgi:hypothetical protein
MSDDDYYYDEPEDDQVQDNSKEMAKESNQQDIMNSDIEVI